MNNSFLLYFGFLCCDFLLDLVHFLLLPLLDTLLVTVAYLFSKNLIQLHLFLKLVFLLLLLHESPSCFALADKAAVVTLRFITFRLGGAHLALLYFAQAHQRLTSKTWPLAEVNVVKFPKILDQ